MATIRLSVMQLPAIRAVAIVFVAKGQGVSGGIELIIVIAAPVSPDELVGFSEVAGGVYIFGVGRIDVGGTVGGDAKCSPGFEDDILPTDRVRGRIWERVVVEPEEADIV